MNPTDLPPGSIDNATKALNNCMSKFLGLGKHRSIDHYVPQYNDVFVVTRGKSGTTLMQNLVYQLVLESGGGPDWDPKGTKFTDIGQVVPFLDLAGVTGVASNNSTPRVFKTGISPREVNNPTARFIYIMRNGMEIPGSLLDFIVPWFNIGLELTQADREKIFRMYLAKKHLVESEDIRDDSNPFKLTWFEHVHMWTSLKQDNILVLSYEGVCRNKKGAVDAVAEFLKLDVSEEGKKRVVESCDRDAMASDPRFKESLLTNAMGWNPSGGVKVRKAGKDGFRGIAFTEKEKELYNKLFKKTFGADTYEELVKKVAVPL